MHETEIILLGHQSKLSAFELTNQNGCSLSTYLVFSLQHGKVLLVYR